VRIFPSTIKKNQEIIEATAKLVAESLSSIKAMGLMDVDFLRVLSTDDPDERGEIYSEVHQSVKEVLFEEELLPTSDGTYTSADEAALAGSQALTELLDSGDLAFLFERSNWLDTGITSDRTPALWNYLRNALDVEEVDFRDFAQGTDVDFLERKSDHWMAAFYTQLRDQTRLWRKRPHRPTLRTEPIIRTKEGEHVAPFDKDGNPKVYLPTEQASEYTIVKPSLADNEDVRAFLEEDLGLEPPDLFSEIREFVIPRYENRDGDPAGDDYFRDLEKMFSAYEQPEAGQKKKRLVAQLKELPFIKSVNPDTGEQHLQKPTAVYLNTGDLRKYFAADEETWFVADDVTARFEDDSFTHFLKEIGVASCPRRIKFDPELSKQKKRQLRLENCNGYGTNITRKWGEVQEDFDIDGLDAFMGEQVTSDRSMLLWNLLAQRVGSSRRYYFRGRYKWKYQRQSMWTARFKAKFYKTLKQKPWLFDEEGNRKKPYQLTPSQMAADYDLESDGAESLLKHLPFKTEAEDKLPEKRKQILQAADEYNLSLAEIEEFGKEKQKASREEAKPSDDEWTPDVTPGDADLTITESPPVAEESPDLRNQSATGRNGGQTQTENESKNEDKLDVAGDSRQRSSNDGRWGEEAVFEALCKEFDTDDVEVVWCNKEGETWGYDIVIKRNGEKKVYVEVKSRTELHPEWVSVSKTQWEFARDLHNGEGDEECWFCIVPGAETENARIVKLKNPIKEWKRGERLAHPINLKVR
jgi:hypothetical protein